MKWVNLLTLISFSIFFSYCKEEDEPEPPQVAGDLTISNLQYSPTKIPIEPDQATFTISGTFNFINADDGPAKLRFTNSSGADVTIEIVDNSGQTSGMITGYMEFEMVNEPGTYTFDIWLIDGKGRSSNKLSGSITLVIDDRMIHWKKVALPNPNWRMNKVLWANNIFISVGNDGIIITSTEGTEWTKQSSVTSKNLNAIVWSGTQYVAVGNGNIIMTSQEGVTWTKQNESDSIQNLLSVSWSGQQLVAVGYDWEEDKSIILTSPDGRHWSKSTFYISGVELRSVAWSGTRFLAVGNRTTDPCCRTSQCICGFWPVIITSTDGYNWEDHSPVGTGMSGLHNVIWDGSRFVIAGGYFKLVTADGITWNQNSDYYSTNIYLKTVSQKDLSYLGVGLAVGYDKDVIVSSDNGLNWSISSSIEQNIPINSLTDIVWSGRKYVVSGLPGYMFVSPY